MNLRLAPLKAFYLNILMVFLPVEFTIEKRNYVSVIVLTSVAGNDKDVEP